MPALFNNRTYITPTTASVVDTNKLDNPNPSVGNTLAIIGRSDGGAPFTPIWLSSYSDAKKILQSGEGLYACQFAFNPSSETPPPAKILFVRVNDATQATLTLLDDAGNPSINLSSQDYGRYTNGVRVKVESGSLRGKKITTQLGNNYYTKDNIYRGAVSVTYDGSGVATISVDWDSVTLFVDGTQVGDIPLEQYMRCDLLADRISSFPGFLALVVPGSESFPTLGNLDFAQGVTVNASGTTITATLQECINWLNSAAEMFIVAERPQSAGAPPANVPFTYLSGGADHAATIADWQKAFDVLQKEDVQWVVPVTPEPAVWSMAAEHVNYMSVSAGKERRCIIGMGASSSDEDAIAAAMALNSDRASLVHLGMYQYDDRGLLHYFPPYFTAALIGGMAAGVFPGTPLTNKSINIQGIERKLRNPTDTDRLIQGGVLCIEETPKGYKIVESISTWLTDDNFYRVEMSVGATIDYVARAAREAIDDLRGKKGSPITMAEAISRTETLLASLAVPEPMGPGLLVGDKLNPPYKNITAAIVNDRLQVSFQCRPGLPVNYVFIAIAAVP